VKMAHATISKTEGSSHEQSKIKKIYIFLFSVFAR
jgi:hypothetical protein